MQQPPRGRGGAAAEEDDEEELDDEELDEQGEQSAVLSSYTPESGLSSLNAYRPGSQRDDPTANRYYGCLRRHLARFAKATNTPYAKAVTWVRQKQDGERGDVVMMTEEPVSFLTFLEKDSATTAGVYEMALRAMQWWLGKQAQILGASVPKGYIANTPGTRERTKRVLEGKATLATTNMEDLQGDEDDTLSRKDLIKMSTFCMSFVVAVNYFEHTPLLFVLALFTVLYSHALAARGEDMRYMSIGCLKMVLYPTIGPNGMYVLTTVSRKSKCNRSGRFDRQGSLPNMNPLLCAWSALFLNLAFRWIVAHETHPNWGDPEEALMTLFTTPLLRSTADPTKPMSYDTQHELTAGLLDYLVIFTRRVTHFFRGSQARSQDQAGIDPKQVEKMLSKDYTANGKSYSTSIPTGPLLHAGGYDIKNPRRAGAPHLSAASGMSNSDLEKCVDIIFPWLSVEHDKVQAAKARVMADVAASRAVSRNQSKKPKSMAVSLVGQRLMMREASLSAVRELTRVGLRCAGARERDAAGMIDAGAQPMYLKFARHPVYQALTNPTGPTPVFASPEWARFEAALRAAEDIEITLERPPETGSEQWTDGVKALLHPELDRLGVQLASLHSKVDALSAQSGSAAGATAAAGCPSTRAEEPPQPAAAPKAKASRQNNLQRRDLEHNTIQCNTRAKGIPQRKR